MGDDSRERVNVPGRSEDKGSPDYLGAGRRWRTSAKERAETLGRGSTGIGAPTVSRKQEACICWYLGTHARSLAEQGAGVTQASLACEGEITRGSTVWWAPRGLVGRP